MAHRARRRTVRNMKYNESHPSDQQLLLEVEGELSGNDQDALRSHLDACWTCRARRQEMENAIADFIRVHQRELNVALPPVAGPRALLKARLTELSATPPRSSWFFPARRLDWTFAAALSMLAAIGMFLVYSFPHRESRISTPVVVSIPDSRLTPGAAILANREAVC